MLAGGVGEGLLGLQLSILLLAGRRHDQTLAGLTGDRGAREVLKEAAEFVTEVPTEGRGALVDLDTPEDWAEWRAGGAR